jgi:ABC-type transporter Mla MlaB component
MGIEIGHYPEEERLDLTLEGNLDLTLSAEILHVCSLVDRRVTLCAIDATRIVRVFDSGIGLLMLLFDRFRVVGVTPVLIGEIPGMPASMMALLAGPSSRTTQAGSALTGPRPRKGHGSSAT